MHGDSNSNSFNNPPSPGGLPPRLPASHAKESNGLAASVSAAPPLLLRDSNRRSPPVGRFLAILLSLCLALFLADGIISLVDDSLILLFDLHVLTAVRGTLFVCAVLAAIVVYCLIGVTPMIPKRLFLPVTLFNPIAGLVIIPFLIYFYSRLPQIAWTTSLLQTVLGLGILFLAQRGFKFRWPMVSENQLGARSFSWRNLSVFLLVNIFGLLPVVLLYLGLCAGVAVDHFSEGFLALRPSGLVAKARKYAREDGKTIQLYPMSHVGDSAFYKALAQSFPTNSITLMEGVTDETGLLTNKITYTRMAASLGLSEQQTEFRPQGQMVRADVDVKQFTATTIELLNLIMLVHAKGMNPDVTLRLSRYEPPPGFEKQLWDDLLRKRNRRLLEEIQIQLSQSENLIVPWGAAHMPEIAREIQKIGFRLVESTEHVAIQFRGIGKKSKS